MRNHKAPVLFLIFNRPETTRQVFAQIKKYRPKQLFVAADGPRENKVGEKEKCDEARKITEQINWPCKVKRLYRVKNLGCKFAPIFAIDWFFKNVKEGIILEDDCLPNPSFFLFCEEMLEKYRNQKDVFHIGGDNFQPNRRHIRDEYYFSKYPFTWGWATWRRAWRYYDVKMRGWPRIWKSGDLNKYWNSFWEKEYWTVIFNGTYNGKNSAWDYQWVYSIWLNGGQSITPGVNLVENIGFGSSGSSINTNIKTLSVKAREIHLNLKLLGDNYSKIADEYASKHVYRISPLMFLAQEIFYLLKGTIQ